MCKKSWFVRRSVSIESHSNGGRECSTKRSCQYEPIVRDVADTIVSLALVVVLCILGCEFTGGVKKFSPDELVKAQQHCQEQLAAATNKLTEVSLILDGLRSKVIEYETKLTNNMTWANGRCCTCPEPQGNQK